MSDQNLSEDYTEIQAFFFSFSLTVRSRSSRRRLVFHLTFHVFFRLFLFAFVFILVSAV